MVLNNLKQFDLGMDINNDQIQDVEMLEEPKENKHLREELKECFGKGEIRPLQIDVLLMLFKKVRSNIKKFQDFYYKKKNINKEVD